MHRPYTVLLIIPTGIGAAIGGYAGDALPVARAMAQVCDRLVTHPNVMNGAQLYWPIPQALYVEGYGLDQFAQGNWGLRPVHQNRVALVLDQGIEPDLLTRQLQAAEATRATLGLDLTDYVITDEPLGVSLQTGDSGATWGSITRPDSLLRAVEKALTGAGATAIAVVARFPDDPDLLALQAYRGGQGVDPLAGAEAVISHLVVRQFQVPCAHAPALAPLPLDPSISPKSAAEEIGYTFLPCVLAGLSRAPQFIGKHQNRSQGLNFQRSEAEGAPIWADAVDALVLPASACGGSASLSLAASTQVIAVQENTTTMAVPPESVGIKAMVVNSYLEAIGAIAAHRAGVAATALRATMPRLRALSG